MSAVLVLESAVRYSKNKNQFLLRSTIVIYYINYSATSKYIRTCLVVRISRLLVCFPFIHVHHKYTVMTNNIEIWPQHHNPDSKDF